MDTSTKDEYFSPLIYNFYRDEWSVLPELPHSRFDLVVAVPYKKQVLAIGGTMICNNNNICEVTNKLFAWDEDDRKWTTPYPNMPTAQYYTSSICHGSAVIVANGVSCRNPWTLTGAVEVLLINEHRWLII